MLIDLKALQQKYNIWPNIVLHVGAHRAEELDLYDSLGAEGVIWVEGNGNLVRELREKLDPTRNHVVHAVVGEKDGEIVQFNVSNNLQSSSILPLGEHATLFPDVYYQSSHQFSTVSLESLLKNAGVSDVDFINLDIQGAELLALKGFGDFSNVKHIYTEINSREVYQGCALVGQIDEFLAPHGFKRVETAYWNDHPWGDALYVK